MLLYEAKSFAEVYNYALEDLYRYPEYETKPRGLTVKENLNVGLVMTDPTLSVYNNLKRSSQYSYIAGELLWYFSGRDDAKFISNFSKFWLNLQSQSGNVNSAYGDLLFKRGENEPISQWEWAYQSLLKDKDTRQAILHFNRPYHQHFDNKDFVCTMHGTFHIRNNKLHFTINMRSNDAILGLPTDVAFFVMLQKQMLKHLKDTYPDLEMGTYTHFDASLHIYENNFELVEEMLKNEFIQDCLPEIGIDFINKDGSPTIELSKTIDAVEKYIEKKTGGKECTLYPPICVKHDPLFKWIIDKINKKKNF